MTGIQAGQWVTTNPDETFRIGEQIGAQVCGGEILLLDGPLGAGKTVFVKGLATALGVDADEVTSPSFTLVNPYDGRLPVFHIDLYRLDQGASAAAAVDLEEMLSNDRAVIIIEWAHRLGNYRLPSNTWRIDIDGDGDEARVIRIYRRDSDNLRAEP